MANYTKEDLDHVESVLNKLLDWAGVTDDTDGNVEVIAVDDVSVTVDDVLNAIGTIDTIRLKIDN